MRVDLGVRTHDLMVAVRSTLAATFEIIDDLRLLKHLNSSVTPFYTPWSLRLH